jgi:hypothetical protein
MVGSGSAGRNREPVRQTATVIPMLDGARLWARIHVTPGASRGDLAGGRELHLWAYRARRDVHAGALSADGAAGAIPGPAFPFGSRDTRALPRR